jgi:hypothetical protein
MRLNVLLSDRLVHLAKHFIPINTAAVILERT